MACATCGRAGLPTDTWGVAEPPYPWEVPDLCCMSDKSNQIKYCNGPSRDAGAGVCMYVYHAHAATLIPPSATHALDAKLTGPGTDGPRTD